MSLFDQINTADNSNEAAAKEKHIPTIKLEKISDGKVKVKINVGEGKHPNEIDHWIQWVELRVNNLFIGRAEFSAAIMDPITEFTVNVKAGSVISVIERCNKHGLWEAQVTV
ncbi:MAG TPA: desulfoferrodoxin [Spirochaetia bacterium]|nr:MAG: hypothetical protein A2Y41_00820 [Spirochaetes bacterium GWB1_36_13]HCL56712.1 desulfoferrodoxin [Spirochaetia bacterium]